MPRRVASEQMAIEAIDDGTAGTIALGELTVRRLGFGAMRITGEGVWGRRPTARRHWRCCGARSSSAST